MIADIQRGGFRTDAVSMDQFWRDFSDYALQERRKNGMVAPSVGVTSPSGVDGVTDAQSFIDMTSNWTAQNKQRKGGRAFDMATTSSDATYSQRRYDFLAAAEAVRRRAYDDATGLTVGTQGAQTRGNVTVGIGFNMDRKDARAVFKTALGHGDDVFDSVYAGKTSLTDQEVRALFEFNANEAEQIVDARFGKDLKEHQRLALVSMAFNGPSLLGPRMVALFKSGDLKGVVNQILHRSNRQKLKGLASRRYKEAAMFEGPVSIASDLPDYKTYIKGFA